MARPFDLMEVPGGRYAPTEGAPAS